MRHPIAVRVIYPEEDRELGWLVGVVGGLCTLLMASAMPHEILGLNRWLALSMAFVMWIGGQLLAWRKRPKVTLAISAEGFVLLGNRRFPTRASQVSVARAEKGFSIAVVQAARTDGIFVEVENEHDARALVAALGGSWEARTPVAMRARRERVRTLQRALAAFGMTCWVLYGLTRGVLDIPDYKATFGVPGLLAGILSSLLFVFDAAFRRTILVGRDVPEGEAAIDAHARLHRRQQEVVPPSVPTRGLAREDESTQDWLTRIDTIGTGADGYRSDAMTTDELWRVLDDRDDATDARLGAARILAKRYRVDASEICIRAVDLSDRVDAILRDTPDEAAEALEKKGPYFRIT